MINKIVIATKNTGKVNEIKGFLKGLNIELTSLNEYRDIGEIAETGNSFEENAFIKANAVYRIVKLPVLSDDSGLEVDYLKGAPGIYSARYSGENPDDNKNILKLLNELKGVKDQNRSAAFKCALVLLNGTEKLNFSGICAGKIITEPRGNCGFGYDPVFVPSGYSITFAEMDGETKSLISHRGKALKKLTEYLKNTMTL